MFFSLVVYDKIISCPLYVGMLKFMIKFHLPGPLMTFKHISAHGIGSEVRFHILWFCCDNTPYQPTIKHAELLMFMTQDEYPDLPLR
jgi:hypothetical protein